MAIQRTQFLTGKKLANKFLGPYEIVKINRNGRYQVKKAAEFEGPKSTPTSCDYMKSWKDAEGTELSEANGEVGWPNVDGNPNDNHSESHEE